MSGLKTLLTLLIVLPSPGGAAERSLMSDFATCAGRFSAELEHAWLMSDELADEIERRRHMFIDLLEAAIPSEQSCHALHLRIEAKVAHASLLTQATFSPDQERALWPVRRAKAEIAHCNSFLHES